MKTPIITSELLACPPEMDGFDLGFAGDWPGEIDVGSGMEFFQTHIFSPNVANL
jgi:hypothetical protein